MDLKNKKVLVLGLAKSGKAAVRLLEHFGAQITISESNKLEDIDGVEDYLARGIQVISGHVDEVVEGDYD